MPIIFHPEYRSYFFGPEHPFRPVRYDMTLDLLEAIGERPELIAPPGPASREDVLRVHSAAFVRHVETASEHGMAENTSFGLTSTDTPAFEGMDEAARFMAGGTLYAAKQVLENEARPVLQLGGGLHHAHRDRASGFCVYNDLAIGIHHLVQAGCRVAYIDIDVHHGDGVQSIFYDAPEVLTLSLHETGRFLFPGTGFVDELGEGAGEGFKLNLPLAPDTTDDSYLEVFEEVVPHALSWFRPDVLLVQSGADAHADDPLAHLRLSTHAYERLFRRLLQLADEHTGGRIVFTLGGGYALTATPRIWALLALIVEGRPLPETLPDAWRARWQERRSLSLPQTLHDPAAQTTASRDRVRDHNRRMAKKLLEKTGRLWRRR